MSYFHSKLGALEYENPAIRFAVLAPIVGWVKRDVGTIYIVIIEF